MKHDPLPRKDRKCACGKRCPVPDDPFCSTAGCRAYHGCSLTEKPQSGNTKRRRPTRREGVLEHRPKVQLRRWAV